MLHAFEPRLARRVFVLPTAAFVLLGGSVTLIIIGQPLAGAIALAVSAWISYQLVRYTVYQFRSRISTDDDAIVCMTSMGFETRLEWHAVSHAGEFTARHGGVHLFVYSEATDELLTIPPYYTERARLESELRTRAPNFIRLDGERPEDLSALLRPYLDEKD